MVTTSTALLLLVTGVLIVLLAMLILLNQNRNATKGYRLRTLERERTQLLIAEETLKMHIAESQSLKTFQEDTLINAMLPVEKPLYIQSDTAVAQNEE